MPKPVAKSRRKSWKKVNVEDVEEALEDDRMVSKIKNKSIRGKVPADEAEDLFTVDTKGSFEGISETSKRALARAKIFPPKGPRIGISASEELKIHRAEVGLKAPKKAQSKAKADAFDLWAAPDSKTKAQLAREAEFERVKRVAQKAPVKAPKSLSKQNSAAPAVLLAHEGQSVNPDKSSFEELACIAAARELEREEDEKELERKLHPMTEALREELGDEAVEKMDDIEKVTAYRKLLGQEAEAEEAAAGEGNVSKQRKFKIKSQSWRNKDKKRKVVDFQQDQKKQQQRLEKSVGEVGLYLKDMKEDEEYHKNRKQYREAMRKQRKELEAKEGVIPKQRRLGSHKFQEPALEVPSAQASGTGLRSMSLRSDTVVRDRLTSIMRRGLLPSGPLMSGKTERKTQKSKIQRKTKFASPAMRDLMKGT